jgi:hypothetical protein
VVGGFALVVGAGIFIYMMKRWREHTMEIELAEKEEREKNGDGKEKQDESDRQMKKITVPQFDGSLDRVESATLDYHPIDQEDEVGNEQPLYADAVDIDFHEEGVSATENTVEVAGIELEGYIHADMNDADVDQHDSLVVEKPQDVESQL